MSSHDEIISALTAHYQEIMKQPGLEGSELKIPPATGWDSVDTVELRNAGKSEGAIELLRRMPYLEGTGDYDRILVDWDSVSIAYTQRAYTSVEDINPLPSHCVYLTEGEHLEGYSLILDTEKGRIWPQSSTNMQAAKVDRHYYDL
jgi:hypothetical protein